MTPRPGRGPVSSLVSRRSRAAVKAGKGGSQPFELLAEHADYFRTCRLDYHEGEKYPVLERLAGKPDVLATIVAATAGGAGKN